MTEITEIAPQNDSPQQDSLPPAVRQFVLHWGEMGGQWGVNRTVAQIHALLYLAERPMHAEEISDQLAIARSNASNSLKELMGWKLIRRVPIMGDRRDHFTAELDLWQMMTRIAEGRKQREIDPAVAALSICREEAANDPRISAAARERIESMHDFVTTMDGWYSEMITIPTGTLARLIKMGRKVLKFIPKGKKAD
ncbi:GbsR/MarR family transcriptional regulator [Alterisphingorhabdus coralli]|uniref:HTH-type transcriptional regulator n=1 Tax=Alterisphingorhabdus coralli TaxID=3071408 RepID=A0AA97F8L6_9SPHN|nr:MarR family transcriptional regulator [Parasphingorhabdus sp. SCSIO 66989]WOE75293.1 MarR family transcriptional regulator [Parasphingorhabdus sp. SCSIO 66989]